jgi:uncharacterized membrane protein YdfJ with MMPL/SSD domain
VLDTFIVRPVLLPAAVAVLGRAGWWPTHPGRARPAQFPSGDAPQPAEPAEPPIPIGATR